MPTKIGPNKTSLYGGSIFQIIAIAAIGYCISAMISTHWKFDSGYRTIRLCIIFGGLLYWIIRYAPGFYSMPYWVSVDDDLKTMELKYLLGKPKLIRREHMVSYADKTVSIRTRSGTTTYSGLQICLNDDTKVLLSERNLEDCTYIGSMLNYWGIKKLESKEVNV